MGNGAGLPILSGGGTIPPILNTVIPTALGISGALGGFPLGGTSNNNLDTLQNVLINNTSGNTTSGNKADERRNNLGKLRTDLAAQRDTRRAARDTRKAEHDAARETRKSQRPERPDRSVQLERPTKPIP